MTTKWSTKRLDDIKNPDYYFKKSKKSIKKEALTFWFWSPSVESDCKFSFLNLADSSSHLEVLQWMFPWFTCLSSWSFGCFYLWPIFPTNLLKTFWPKSKLEWLKYVTIALLSCWLMMMMPSSLVVFRSFHSSVNSPFFLVNFRWKMGDLSL